jgi:glycolate oxidase iron-sulfur subunit
MNTETDFDRIKELVNNCDRCGTCLTVCPLYAVKPWEASAARGKNSIARVVAEEALAIDDAVVKAMNYCLLCKACTANCPSKIKTDEAMILVREHIAKKCGIAVSHKAIAFLMGSRLCVDLAAKAMAVMKLFRLDKLLAGIMPREFARSQFQRMLAGPAILEGSAERMPEKAVTGKRIAYFKGCAMKMMFPDAAASSLKLLQQTADVTVPESDCCGMPHLAHGMREQAMLLAKSNIDRFGDFDLIVTDCASCGSMLKEYGHLFREDAKWKDKAAAFSRKVRGLSEYLHASGYSPHHKKDVVITYHDPCHLVRGQGIKKQPRELLKAAGKYVEMPNADVCCGGAGTFQIDFPEESQKILQKKFAGVRQTKAQILVTECPACLIQMAKINTTDEKFKVMHISQVL